MPTNSSALLHPRVFDDGAPLVVSTATQADHPSKHFLVVPQFCDNPDCLCRDMTPVVRRIEPAGNATGRVIESSKAAVTFDVDTATVSPHDDLGGIERSQELVDGLSCPLLENDRLPWHHQWSQLGGMDPVPAAQGRSTSGVAGHEYLRCFPASSTGVEIVYWMNISMYGVPTCR